VDLRQRRTRGQCNRPSMRRNRIGGHTPHHATAGSRARGGRIYNVHRRTRVTGSTRGRRRRGLGARADTPLRVLGADGGRRACSRPSGNQQNRLPTRSQHFSISIAHDVVFLVFKERNAFSKHGMQSTCMVVNSSPSPAAGNPFTSPCNGHGVGRGHLEGGGEEGGGLGRGLVRAHEVHTALLLVHLQHAPALERGGGHRRAMPMVLAVQGCGLVVNETGWWPISWPSHRS